MRLNLLAFMGLAPLVFATSALAAGAANLQPPNGATEIGRYPAKGDQIYSCTGSGQANSGVSAWTLKAPDAWLEGPDGSRFAHHYAGPTWEANDGSTVKGKVLATAPVPSSIPQLLLSATETGKGALAGTRFVQRVDTKGGVAPTGACSAGEERRVPYTATYVFWR